MKRMPWIIDKGLTVFSYVLIIFCFYLLVFTRIDGAVVIEGFLLAAYSLFVRDAYNMRCKRLALCACGFEDEMLK